jgi:hypothetical protein
MKNLSLIFVLLLCFYSMASTLSKGEVDYLCNTINEDRDYYEFAYYLSQQGLKLSEVYNEIKCDYDAFGQPNRPLLFGLSVVHHTVISRIFQKFIQEDAHIELSCALGFQTYAVSPNHTVLEIMKGNYKLWSQMNSANDEYGVIKKVNNFYKSVIPLYERHLKQYPVLNLETQCQGF